ncbi:MAG: hypothetical protein JNK44_08170 [Cyclobacteriaceae bacterium]|nr:hypothetical protein [Cyclobacteriaceae bacterium]
MEQLFQIFYRNNRSLSFKIVESITDILDSLPTVVIYVDNGEFIYQPYILKDVVFAKRPEDIRPQFQYYFILQHNIYHSTNLELVMKSIEGDLKSGRYFTFGKIDNSPFEEL